MQEYKYIIDQLFADADAAAARGDKFRRNPVTGGQWVKGQDSTAKQKRLAAAAMRARDRFELERPPDAPTLPLTQDGREELKTTGRSIDYLTALYARSWASLDYGDHPAFTRYVSAVLAAARIPAWILNDPDIASRFPPVPDASLQGGCLWQPWKRFWRRRCWTA